LRGFFLCRAVTTLQRIPLEQVEVPPGLYKILIRNMAGQTMAASGNVLAYRGHEMATA